MAHKYQTLKITAFILILFFSRKRGGRVKILFVKNLKIKIKIKIKLNDPIFYVTGSWIDPNLNHFNFDSFLKYLF